MGRYSYRLFVIILSVFAIGFLGLLIDSSTGLNMLTGHLVAAQGQGMYHWFIHIVLPMVVFLSVCFGASFFIMHDDRMVRH